MRNETTDTNPTKYTKTSKGYTVNTNRPHRYTEISGWVHVDHQVWGEWIYLGYMVRG